MAVILCFTRLETIILCSPPLLWQTVRASAEMISNRFSKMLSTRLPPYIISFQWAENKNLIHKSIATSINAHWCTFYFVLSRFYTAYILFTALYIDGHAAGRRLSSGFSGSQETVQEILWGEHRQWGVVSVLRIYTAGRGTCLWSPSNASHIGEREWGKVVQPWMNSLLYPLSVIAQLVLSLYIGTGCHNPACQAWSFN